MSRIQVAIVMGSLSDREAMEEAAHLLEDFGVGYEMKVLSAHRSPRLAVDFASTARQRGLQVLIAGAGSAAHLAGVLASRSLLPAIGVPLATSPLQGLDSLLSTVQMPAGVPVATMAIGKSGARNAALFAIQILSRQDPALLEALTRYRERQESRIEETQL